MGGKESRFLGTYSLKSIIIAASLPITQHPKTLRRWSMDGFMAKPFTKQQIEAHLAFFWSHQTDYSPPCPVPSPLAPSLSQEDLRRFTVFSIFPRLPGPPSLSLSISSQHLTSINRNFTQALRSLSVAVSGSPPRLSQSRSAIDRRPTGHEKCFSDFVNRNMVKSKKWR